MPPLESRKERPLPLPGFLRRLAGYLGAALLIAGGSLGLGVLGYHEICGFGWIDALLNASMILGGMGPVDELHGEGAKIFASCYALFSGVVFIAVMGVALTPIAHRLLHKFHMEEDD